jgi:3D (Asp-Asp-Asp) domain-containing protein
MSKFKINKKVKVMVLIFLIVVLSFKLHLSYKKHVEYKRIKKPTQSKKVKIYKKFAINKKKEITFNENDLSQYHNLLQRIKNKQDYDLQQSIAQHNKEYEEKQTELRRQDELRKQEEERQRQEQIRQQQEIQRQKELELQKAQQNKQVNNAEVNRGGDNQQGQQVKLRISYYTNSDIECGNSLGITASGRQIQQGMIAAPSNIPFGTKIIINESEYVVTDRGGAIGYEGDTMKIDIYVPNASQSQLNRLGVKYTTGYIVK